MPAIAEDYERIVQEVYEALLHPGDIVVDIGAHTGRHTLPMAACVIPGGTVFAVEPLSHCRAAIAEQIEAERVAGVVLLPYALADRSGRGTLHYAVDWPAFSGLRQVPLPGGSRIQQLVVDIQTVDELFQDQPRLRFLKVDAEGAEWHILRGAEATLERFRPVVAFEFGTWSNREYDVEPLDMARFWHDRDYRLFAITGESLSLRDFVRRAEQRDIWDYIAVPVEDHDARQVVTTTLRRPRVHWLAVRAELQHAAEHVNIGQAVPPLRRFRGLLHPLARWTASVFLNLAKMITIPQSLYNRSLLTAVEQLSQDLEKSERHVQELEKRLAQLEKQQSTPNGTEACQDNSEWHAENSQSR